MSDRPIMPNLPDPTILAHILKMQRTQDILWQISCYILGVTPEMIRQFQQEYRITLEALREVAREGALVVVNGRLEVDDRRGWARDEARRSIEALDPPPRQPEMVSHQRWVFPVLTGHEAYIENGTQQIPIKHIRVIGNNFPLRVEVTLRVLHSCRREIIGVYLPSREGVPLLCYGEFVRQESSSDEPYTEIMLRLYHDRIEHGSDCFVVDVPTHERHRRSFQSLLGLAYKFRPTRPAPCNGCGNYFGETHGGNTIVCAIHPYGAIGDSCSDWEKE
jgi:hypothetical protein